MNADVKKAVEAADQACATYRLGFVGRRHWQTIRQALRDQEEEIARLRRNLQAYVDNGWLLPAPMIRDLLNGAEIYTAHLGGEHE